MSNATTSTDASTAAQTQFDAIIVGAGFAGMYMLHRLRAAGFTSRVIEAGDGVGGTWYWNRYPGARCDVESMEYQYGFDDDLAREWKWTERYAAQPEILNYANHVADRFDLRRDMQFETRVTSAHFDESTNTWTVKTDRGDTYTAKFCIMATGCLSAARVPDFKGRELYRGETYHTGNWPHEGVDFSGKRIAIIGTGSSAVQSIPHLAENAAHLTVFQRTPNYSLPAMNDALDVELREQMSQNYTAYRQKAMGTFGGIIREVGTKSIFDDAPEERERNLEERWGLGGFAFSSAYNDIGSNIEANEVAAEFVRKKIREVVKDPATAELLCPKDYPIGTKRLCIDTNYFETYNRDNVKLVDIKNNPIAELTETGLRLQDGQEFEFDAIVFATGFDAMTGALTSIDIRGRNGLTIKEKWAAGPRTYLGLQSQGFPNLFTITGPGSPSVLSNMIVAIEQHVNWIEDAMKYLREHHIATIEPDVAAEDAWVDHVNEVAARTLYMQANSWYLGANVPGKPRVFMPYVGGLNNYDQKCRDVVAKGYEGFKLTADEHALAAV